MSDIENKNLLRAGATVRLKSDPGRRGTLTGKKRLQGRILKYQVEFSDVKSFQPDYELELINDDNSDWEQLLEEGRFGRVRDLRRNLTHIHLSGRLANLVYSMDATNTDFYAYQYKPVLSFLESPSNGLLIADEVGLGKTIEAGLIWTELRARFDARRLMVVCPAMLREKWCSELANRFGVDAQIMGAAEVLEYLQKGGSVPEGKGIVCSIQGLRPPKGWRKEEKITSDRAKLARFLDDKSAEEPLIDLVIIDEAHYLRNPESQTAKLGQLLRGVAANIVLLSATPINLRSDDLFHLLNLVDPDSFNVKEVFPKVISANEHLQKARDLVLDRRTDAEQIREELLLAQRHPLLQDSRQLQQLVSSEDLSDFLRNEAGRVRLANRIEKVNLLRHAITRTRKSEVTEWRVIREPLKYFIELDKDGVEWQFYQLVTEAIRRFAYESDISDGFLLAGPQRQVSSCMYAAALAWKDKYNSYDEQLYEDIGDCGCEWDTSPLIQRLQNDVLPHVSLTALKENDSKYVKFREAVKGYLAGHRDEKLIVFSYFRKTLEYLAERLLEDGIKSQVLVGGMKETKQDVISRFKESPDVSVLLSSEVASEGVDLQFCKVLFNYDLPWNPMKVEQRIGRIDRIGQRAKKIQIVNLLIKDTIDHRIHDRLYERLRIFERALGSMEAILGEEISALTADLLTKPLTPEQEQQRIDQTAMAIERIRHEQDELEKNASHLVAHGGYILESVHAAHQLKKRITEEDLFAYVKDYLDKFCKGHEFEQISSRDKRFKLKLPTTLAVSLKDFIDRNKLHGKTRLAMGESIRCKFANKVRDPATRDEVISQFHPLVRFIGQELREKNEAFYPLVAIRLVASENIAPGTYAFMVNRWEFTGVKVEEELSVRVVEMDSNRLLSRDESWALLNLARVDGKDWLEAGNELDKESLKSALDRCAEALEEDYNVEKSRRKTENEDRAMFQIQSAKRHQERQLISLEQQLERYRATEKRRMIPAMEGKIKKIKERFDHQRETLESKSKLRTSQFEVCCGVILVVLQGN